MRYPQPNCELGGDAAGTCGVGLARTQSWEAFPKASPSACLVPPARFHSHEKALRAKLVSVCGTHISPNRHAPPRTSVLEG
jgi:hypothetical protein